MSSPAERAKYIREAVKGLVWVGQLGFSLAVPPIAMGLIAFWLRKRFSLGVWVMIAAVMTGLLASVSTACGYYKDAMAKEKKDAEEHPRPRGYSDHR